MLSIRNRIQIALAVHEGDKQFHKELRAYDRAAGAKKNNEDESSSNSTESNDTTKKTSFRNSTKKEKKKDKKNKNKKAEENTKNDTDNVTVSEVESEAKETHAENVDKPNNTPRTEQQMNAEAEAPVERAGAEVISADIDAEQSVNANMGSNVHIPDNEPGVLNFESFGIKIDTNMTGESSPVPTGFTIPQPSPIQQPNTVPNRFNPIFNSAGNPMMGANFIMNPMPGMDTYGQMLNQQQVVPPVGLGRHKVDNPVPVKPPKGPKSKPDEIDMEGMPNLVNGMDVEYFPKMDIRNYGVLEDKVPKEVEKVPMESIFPKNKELYKNYNYLQDVEKVALDNGYQIGFAVRPTGLIDCIVCNEKGEPIPNKGFVIDPGFIIDHRKKVFAGLYQYYEGQNAYPLFVNGLVVDGKKSPNTFNEELIKGLIVGGNDTVNNMKGMYTEDFRNLNTVVALITIPTHEIGPADRKYIQSRLVDLYKGGVFSDILATDPNSRFRIADYNKNTNTILLDNNGVPKCFGGLYHPGDRMQIKITKDKCKTLRGNNIINVP